MTQRTQVGEELSADGVVALVATVGACAGVFAGVAVGGEIGSAFPAVFATLGVMLGSGSAVGAWFMLTSLWAARPGTARSGASNEVRPARAARVSSGGESPAIG